jgi:GAF domain-containing protein
MKRRAGASSKPAKARRGKPAKSKRPGNVPRAVHHRGDHATDIAQLRRELNESQEQQTATAEVLKVISRSHFDLQSVLDTLIETAARLCGAKRGVVFRRDGELYRATAFYNASPELVDFVTRHPVAPGRHTITARVALERRAIHVADLQEDPEYTYALRDTEPIRTELGVPMFRGDDLVGVFILYKLKVEPFTDKQLELATTFAAQAVIAIENARLLGELRQSLEEQTATSEILEVISNSPTNSQPAFDAIVRSGLELFPNAVIAISLPDGDKVKLAAIEGADRADLEALRARYPLPLSRDYITSTAILDRREMDFADARDTPAQLIPGGQNFLASGYRGITVMPMTRGETAIGAISVVRRQPGALSDKQRELLRSFASQAVIAIENTRLFNELRLRTTDLTEALEQQTATSEVLQTISRFPGELEPVFSTMLENAVRICDAKFGNIYRWDGNALSLVAACNTPPAFAEARRLSPHLPADSNTNAMASVPGRMVAAKSALHIADLAADQAYVDRRPQTVAAVELGGVRTFLAVPMLKDDQLIGAFALSRQEVHPFTDRQIELVKNFAAQAVIAIENARVLNELRQSLEQQTATAEVLQVVGSSLGDLEPIFGAMLEKAVRICDAKFGNIYGRDGDVFCLLATHNTPPALAEHRKHAPIRSDPTTLFGRMMAAKAVVHVADLKAERAYIERVPETVSAVELGGIRTILAVPMLKENEVVGAFTVYRQQVNPFTDKQIALVTNFAAQAVIAIENARLLAELRQSLEQQTAAAEVLQVISSSPGHLQPVFAAMLERAARLCDAKFGNIFRWDDEALHLVATHNTPTAFTEARTRSPLRPDPANPIGRMLATQTTVHVSDLAADARYIERTDPDIVFAVDLGGIRTFVAAPMVKEKKLIGALILYRQEVRPFTDKQVELLENFASQAVIAIENARLLGELREKTEDVIKLNQQLEQRVADQVGEIERMGRLRRFLPPQVADLIVASGAEKQLESHRREITALFCDLRGFTGFTESADAEDVMALLRDYHAAIGETIIKYSGTLERYAGDGVMVVFNDPVPIEKPALQAVLMALEMRDVIGALTEKWRRMGHEIGFGIGIAHGFATLGTIGFEGRFDYAAIGTVANVASRLCDEAKPGQILISPRVLMAVDDAVTVEPAGEFTLKGIRRPLAAYNVLAAVSA